jgi:hypothetical protein
VKKLLAGCLVVLVLGVIVAVVGGYFLYRAASPMLQNAKNYLEGMAEITELDEQVTNKSAYTAPASGELTEAQVDRFVQVQDGIRAALGQRFDEIEAKYEHLKGTGGSPAQPSIGDLIGALSDLGNLFVQAKRYQVDALNKQGFSPAEYSWVRDRVFQAAGMEVTSKIDLKQLEDAVRDGTGLEDFKAPRVPTLEVPEKNRALVKPHLDKADQWLPLVFFGL